MKHLSYPDRLRIEWCLSHRMTKVQTAREIGCSLKTIYNELARGGYWHTDPYGVDRWRYSADIAQQDMEYKATAKGRPDKLGHNWTFINYIEDQIINLSYSPAVALQNWFSSEEYNGLNISVNTLYRYIDCGLYFPNLTNKDLLEKPHRKRRKPNRVKPKRAPRGTPIDRRPKEINARVTFGHWEMDCVVGKAKGKEQSVLVLTERLTRFEVIVKLKSKTSKSVVSALSKLDKQYTFKSITVDNGAEFQDCKGMTFKPNGKRRTYVYYCHPYSSFERGSNERMNRMIRRFLPKGQSLSKITQVDCTNIQNWLNAYPRKILGWKSPHELFDLYTSKEKISNEF